MTSIISKDSSSITKLSEQTRFICHRVNSLSEYIVKDFKGIEFDIRDSNGLILVTHDPFTTGMELESFVIRLPKVDDFLYIVNVKSEGIEEKAREILERNEIKNFFFLDSSFPTIVKMSKDGEKRFAIRASEYESIQTAIEMSGKVNFVWIDCFTKFVPEHVMLAKGMGYNVCLVSPELHKHSNYISFINSMCEQIKKYHLVVDYICCKPHVLDIWKSFLDE
jgi:hypothetical protein